MAGLASQFVSQRKFMTLSYHVTQETITFEETATLIAKHWRQNRFRVPSYSLIYYNSISFLYIYHHRCQSQSSSGSSSITYRAFHPKLKCHLFKNSYPDSSDPTSSHCRPNRRPSLTAAMSNLSLLWTRPTLLTILLIRRGARE